METDIQSNVVAFHDRLKRDENHRYRSWEHCYSHFSKRPSDLDTSSLHLAFYLASWGMYRGSSFLLWKDYKVHHEVVRCILSAEHDILRGLDYTRVQKDGKELGALFDLVQRIKNWYPNNIEEVDGKKRKVNVTDVLATKILLGTIGCIPAYDRYFVLGLKYKGLSFSYLNKKNYWELIEFYRRNQVAFDSARKAISSTMPYPVMKVVDMYFWNVGFTLLPEDDEDAT